MSRDRMPADLSAPDGITHGNGCAKNLAEHPSSVDAPMLSLFNSFMRSAPRPTRSSALLQPRALADHGVAR